jgi:molybdenum cofactor cytidylyltransferase
MSVSLGVMLLAAGGSSRLGQPKQLLRIDGETLVRRNARFLLSLQPDHAVVVTGSSSSSVSKELEGLPLCILHNPDWRTGMGSSIALGAGKLPQELDGVLILLCDQWRIKVADLKQIIEFWKTDISQIIVSSWTGETTFSYGPPVLFPRKYIRELTLLQGDQGARSLIARNKNDAHFLDLENAAFDVDVAADLEALTSWSE